jgi:nucleoside 2-deoxyribosyltransferase
VIIYLAGPISGQTPEAVFSYLENTSERLKSAVPGVIVLLPMLGKTQLRTEKHMRAEGYSDPLTCNHHIIERDRWMVAKSDVVYADFTKAPEYASLGTCMELAWAYDQKYTYSVVSMGEENIHRHAFVLEAADAVFTDREEALLYLETLLRGI